jgi:hypothetical protein
MRLVFAGQGARALQVDDEHSMNTDRSGAIVPLWNPESRVISLSHKYGRVGWMFHDPHTVFALTCMSVMCVAVLFAAGRLG